MYFSQGSVRVHVLLVKHIFPLEQNQQMIFHLRNMHTYTHIRTHARTHARTNAHTHTHTDIHPHTHTHARTHARAHTHTLTWLSGQVSCLSLNQNASAGCVYSISSSEFFLSLTDFFLLALCCWVLQLGQFKRGFSF